MSRQGAGNRSAVDEGVERGGRAGAEDELGELLDRGDRLQPLSELLRERTETPLQISQEDSTSLGERALLSLFYPFLLPSIRPTKAAFGKHRLDLLKIG